MDVKGARCNDDGHIVSSSFYQGKKVRSKIFIHLRKREKTGTRNPLHSTPSKPSSSFHSPQTSPSPPSPCLTLHHHHPRRFVYPYIKNPLLTSSSPLRKEHASPPISNFHASCNVFLPCAEGGLCKHGEERKREGERESNHVRRGDKISVVTMWGGGYDELYRTG